MPHPKYGERHTCFECGTKFYTMNKPHPICPKCGADQRKAPKKPSGRAPKTPVVVEDYEAEDDTLIEDVDDFTGADEETFSPDDELLVDDVPDQEY